jgi:hypothetical protein
MGSETTKETHKAIAQQTGLNQLKQKPTKKHPSIQPIDQTIIEGPVIQLKSSWNIVVTPTNKNSVFQIREITCGLIQCLSQFDSNISISSVPDSQNSVTILNSDTKLPTKGDELAKFIDNPRTNNSGKLIFRLFLHSSKEIIANCNQPEVRQWLETHKVKLFESKLKTSKPTFAGFYDEPNPNKFGTVFLDEKIQNLLGPNDIDIQVEIRPLYLEGKGNSCLVYMIMTSAEQVTNLRLKLKKGSDHLYRFYSWTEYQDLSHLQKVHLIQEQKANNTQLKCKFIDGYNDINIYNKDIQGQDETKSNGGLWEDQSSMELSRINDVDNSSWEDQTDANEDMLISHTSQIENLLKTEFLLINGKPMIKGLSGPVNGRIQVWYGREAVNQTESLLAVLNTELARNMTTKCIELTFSNPNEIYEQVNNSTQWTPTELLNTVPMASYAYASNKYDSRIKRNNQRKNKFSLTTTVEINNATNNEITTAETHMTQKSPTNTPANWIGYKDKSKVTFATQQSNQQQSSPHLRTETTKYHQNTDSKMQQYCLDLINQSKIELQQDITKNAKRIEQISNDTRIELKRVDEGIAHLRQSTTEAYQQLRQENQKSLDTMSKNHDSLMAYLMTDKENRDQQTQDSRRDYSHDSRNLNNFASSNPHNTPDRTATPFGFNRSRCNQNGQTAGKQ